MIHENFMDVCKFVLILLCHFILLRGKLAFHINFNVFHSFIINSYICSDARPSALVQMRYISTTVCNDEKMIKYMYYCRTCSEHAFLKKIDEVLSCQFSGTAQNYCVAEK